ncbi:MAG: hypothetical protein U9R41_02525 [Candidatus Marinimicrobia bacterium]|nr:hypothetical protein [Candidatus Neomarinimicrobiota bacterium]
MAKILFTLNEIFEIAKKNRILPNQMESISSKNNNIKLKIKPMTFIPILNIDLEFENYKNEIISLKLKSYFITFITKKLQKYLKQLNELDWIEIHNSQILIFPNKIIKNYITGIEITNLYFDNHSLIIETKNKL